MLIDITWEPLETAKCFLAISKAKEIIAIERNDPFFAWTPMPQFPRKRRQEGKAS